MQPDCDVLWSKLHHALFHIFLRVRLPAFHLHAEHKTHGIPLHSQVLQTPSSHRNCSHHLRLCISAKTPISGSPSLTSPGHANRLCLSFWTSFSIWNDIHITETLSLDSQLPGKRDNACFCSPLLSAWYTAATHYVLNEGVKVLDCYSHFCYRNYHPKIGFTSQPVSLPHYSVNC